MRCSLNRRSGSRYADRIRIGRASALSRNSLYKYASGCCDMRANLSPDAMIRPFQRSSRRMKLVSSALAFVCLLTLALAAQPQVPSTATPPLHATQPRRLVIKNAMVIYGNAKPPYGPVDIVVQNGVISYIGTTTDVPSSRSSDAVIDASGKYVMPGIVNAHMHWHEERQPGMPQPIQYERNLYLAAGVTTAREVGGDFDKSKRWQ